MKEKKGFRQQLREADFKAAFAVAFKNFFGELQYAFGGEYTPKMTYREYKDIKDAKN